MTARSMIDELECIALTEDLREHGLTAGNVGMIVHVYDESVGDEGIGDKIVGYEIEFVT